MNIHLPPIQQTKLSKLPSGSLVILAERRTFGILFDCGGNPAVVLKDPDHPRLQALLCEELDDDVLHLHEAETRARPDDLRSFAIARHPQDLPQGALLYQADDWLVRAEASQMIQAHGSIRVSLKTFTKVAWGTDSALYFNNGWQLRLVTDPTRPEVDQTLWQL